MSHIDEECLWSPFENRWIPESEWPAKYQSIPQTSPWQIAFQKAAQEVLANPPAPLDTPGVLVAQKIP